MDAVDELVDQGRTGIFHVAGDDRVTKYQFGLEIAERFAFDPELIRPIKLRDQQALTIRPYDMSLSCGKAELCLGRKLGGVKEHLEILYAQDKIGRAKEMRLI